MHTHDIFWKRIDSAEDAAATGGGWPERGSRDWLSA